MAGPPTINVRLRLTVKRKEIMAKKRNAAKKLDTYIFGRHAPSTTAEGEETNDPQ